MRSCRGHREYILPVHCPAFPPQALPPQYLISDNWPNVILLYAFKDGRQTPNIKVMS